MAATTYNETRVNLGGVLLLEADGKTPKTDEKSGEPLTESIDNLKETQATKIIANFKALNLAEPEPTKIQTFQYSEVSTSADLLPLLLQYNPNPDDAEKVAVDIIKRGLTLRQQGAVRDFMLDPEQAAVEGAYDLMIDAAKPGEGRRKADPASKAIKALEALCPGVKFDAAMLEAIKAQFAAQAAAAQ